MTHRMTSLLLIFGLTIAGIVGFLLFNRHSPLSYYTADPKNFEECKKANGVMTLENGVNACTFKIQVFVEHKAKTEAELQRTYTDSEFGFSVNYPGDILREIDSKPALQFMDNKSYDSTTLVHTIDVQHCGLSGLPEHCTPQTTDISITFTPINKKYSEVIAAAQKVFGSLEDVDLGSFKAKEFNQGAEGEGQYYYFIELPNNRTLVVSRTYISEEILSSYQESKDFIKFTEQKKIFDKIMESLTIN